MDEQINLDNIQYGMRNEGQHLIPSSNGGTFYNKTSLSIM